MKTGHRLDLLVAAKGRWALVAEESNSRHEPSLLPRHRVLWEFVADRRTPRSVFVCSDGIAPKCKGSWGDPAKPAEDGGRCYACAYYREWLAGRNAAPHPNDPPRPPGLGERLRNPRGAAEIDASRVTPPPAPSPATHAKAAYGRAVQAHQSFLDSTHGLTPQRAEQKAVASDGEQTISGHKKVPGFADVTQDDVRELADQIGHVLAVDDRDLAGQPGSYQAIHAEKKLAVCAPNEPGAVNRAMCPDCQAFYRRLADDRQEPQTITDPDMTRTFHPNGLVEIS